MKYLENLRGTGRTARMIGEAVKDVKKKLRVCIVTVDDRNCRLLLSELRAKDADKLGISLRYFNDATCSIDPLTARVSFRGETFDKVYIDHYAIECRFDALLNELHRFD